MESPVIRKAIPADLAAVVRISKASFTGDDAFGPGWLLKLLESSGTEMYVDDASAGVVRGYVVLCAHPLGSIVRLIAVDPEFRGHGSAKALLESVKRPAFAWVRTSNTASLNLFKAMGWEATDPPGRKRRDWHYLAIKGPVE